MTNVQEGIEVRSKTERWDAKWVFNNTNVRHLIKLLTDIAPSRCYIVSVIGPDDSVYSDDHRLEENINSKREGTSVPGSVSKYAYEGD